MPILSIPTPYFLQMSDFSHKNINTETIYFMTCIIIFTYTNIKYCCEIAEMQIDGEY